MELFNILLIFVFFIILLLTAYFSFITGKKIASMRVNKEWLDKIPGIRSDAVKRSRAVLAGQFSEQLAPYLPDFNWNPSEARFIGKPVDFIIFKGLDDKEVNEVVFVEVKSGNSRLSGVEKSLKQAIIDKRVSWFEYRIPDNIIKKQPEKGFSPQDL